MSWKSLLSAGCVLSLLSTCLFPTTVLAAPGLRVVDGGLINGNHRVFNVFVQPDPALYDIGTPATASSMAVELGFSALGATIVNATTTAAWQDDGVAPLGNFGTNPFTMAQSEGIVIGGGGTNVFAALGSTDVSPGPGDISGETLVLSLEMSGPIALLDLKGVWNANGTSGGTGALVAQGTTLPGQYGVTAGRGNAPGYAVLSGRFGVVGDFDLDGDVDGLDLGPFAGQFGLTGAAATASFANFDGNAAVDGLDLGPFAARFGLSAPGSPFPPPGSGAAVGGSNVPEPTTGMLLVLAMGAFGTFLRRSRG